MSMNGGQPPSPYDPPSGGQAGLPGPHQPAAPQVPPPYQTGAVPPQSPYGQPGAMPPGPVQPYGPGQYYYNPYPKNSFAVWALVLGICSIVLSCGAIAGVPAIIMGNKARRAVREGTADNDGMALAGLILGWIGTILLTLFWLAYIGFIAFAIFMSANSDSSTFSSALSAGLPAA